MKLLKSLAVLSAFLPTLAFADLTILPEHPGPNDTVTFSFTKNPPGPVDGAMLVVYAIGDSGEKDRVRVAEYPLPAEVGQPMPVKPSELNKGAKFLAAYVEGTAFSDTNNHRYYSTVLYGADGKPLAGAWEAAAEFAQGRAIETLPRMADEKEAAACLKSELEAHPDRLSAQVAQLALQLRGVASLEGDESKKERERVAQAARELYGKLGKSMTDAELSQILAIGGRKPVKPEAMTEEEKAGVQFAAAVRLAAKQRFPKGEVVWQDAFNAARREKDEVKQREAWREFIARYPKSENADFARGQLVGLLLKNKDYEGAKAVARETPVDMLPSVIGPLAEEPETAQLALDLCTKALGNKKRPVNKSLRERERTEANDSLNASLLGMRSRAHQVLGLASLKQAAAIDLVTESLTTAVKLAEAMGDDEALSKAYEGIAERSSLSAEDVAKWEKAYKAASDEKSLAFSDVKANAERISAEKARRDMGRAEVRMPAPGFELKELATGKLVSLASLRGKVVLVDFWATWCGPCRASFPSLQKVQEKYAGNQDVVILTINTWERNEGTEREEAVTKFVADKKLPFRVLFDRDNGDRTIDAYMVSGIPTKFFIDRGGNIRFVDIGFEGEAMVRNVSMKLDQLLSEK